MLSQRRVRCIEAALPIGILLMLGSSPSAQGQDHGTETVAAQALFDQGKQLMGAKKFAEACPKFEESQRLDPGVGTLLNLADCYEREGKLATAWGTFLETAAVARSSGQADREQVARGRAAALAPRLSRVVIDVALVASLEGLAIRRDGVDVGKAQWGVAVPADPGSHRIEAKAQDRQDWATMVSVTGEGATVKVSIPELARIAPPGSAAAADPVRSTGDKGAPDRAATGSSQKVLAVAAGTIGAAGLVLGTIFGLESKSKKDDSKQFCDASSCFDQRGVDLTSDAVRSGNLSTISFAAGIVGLGAGAVLLLTAPSPRASGGSLRTSASVAVGLDSVRFEGTW